MHSSKPAALPPSSLDSRLQHTRHCVGLLEQKNALGDTINSKRIFSDHEVIIGRDKSRCQYLIDEPTISNKHIRVYTIFYDNEDTGEEADLIYAEDLSRNGTYWNGALIGKGTGGVLLSDGDRLTISSQTFVVFHSAESADASARLNSLRRREIEKFSKKYTVTNRLLGSGAHAKVFMAIEQSTKSQLACKVVDLTQLRSTSSTYFAHHEHPAPAEDVDSRVQLRKVKALVGKQKGNDRLDIELGNYYREIEILASVQHPNIIGLEKVFVTNNTLYIFQDLVTAGDLFSYVEYKGGKLLEVEAAVIVRQVLVAVDYIHRLNIVHRDLKPENILMTSLAAGARVVLTDFGTARRINDPSYRMMSFVGTEDYCAPEVLRRTTKLRSKQGYTKAVDMWAIGCIAFILLTGSPPPTCDASHVTSKKSAEKNNACGLSNAQQWQGIRSKPKAFVCRLLVVEEQQRLTAKQALDDPWFSNATHRADFQKLYERAVQNWTRRIPKSPVLEFQDAESIKYLACYQKMLDVNRKFYKPRGRTPIEPPYKPFPRNMNAPLLPKRPVGSRWTPEVKTAIEKYWSAQPDTQASRRKPDPLSQPPTAGTLRSVPNYLSTVPTKVVFARPLSRPLSSNESTETERDKLCDKVVERLETSGISTRTAVTKLGAVQSCEDGSRVDATRSFRRPILGETTSTPRSTASSYHYLTPVEEYGMRKSRPAETDLPRPITPRTRTRTRETNPDPAAELVQPSHHRVDSKLRRRPTPGLAVLTHVPSSARRKRRRGSVFDIDEDEDGLSSQLNQSPLKRPRTTSRATGADTSVPYEVGDVPTNTVGTEAGRLASTTVKKTEKNSKNLYLPRV